MRSPEKVQQDIEAILNSGNAFINGMQKEVNKLPEVLDENEQIKFLMGSYRKGQEYLYICTDKRIIYLKQGWINAEQGELDFNQITNITFETGLMFGKVNINYGSRVIWIQDCVKKSVQPFVYAVKEQMERSSLNTNTANSSMSNISVAEQLEKLAALLERGLISESEFKSQKEKLL